MKATNRPYSITESDDRLRDILAATDQSFGESDVIPSADRLTYDNGFHIHCAALFIDIRGSSKLVEKHTNPVLGKIYRAYISECVAVMNQDANCGELIIQGDCVGGVFHTPLKVDIDSVFMRAAQLNSAISHMNWRLAQRGYSELVCGIGLSYGRALMIKAGYKGSGINDVIWMGNVVNEAAKLCHEGSRGSRLMIQVSSSIELNLNNHNKALLRPVRGGSGIILEPITHYEANVVDQAMEDWVTSKKRESAGLVARDSGARLAQGGLADILGIRR